MVSTLCLHCLTCAGFIWVVWHSPRLRTCRRRAPCRLLRISCCRCRGLCCPCDKEQEWCHHVPSCVPLCVPLCVPSCAIMCHHVPSCAIPMRLEEIKRSLEPLGAIIGSSGLPSPEQRVVLGSNLGMFGCTFALRAGISIQGIFYASMPCAQLAASSDIGNHCLRHHCRFGAHRPFHLSTRRLQKFVVGSRPQFPLNIAEPKVREAHHPLRSGQLVFAAWQHTVFTPALALANWLVWLSKVHEGCPSVVSANKRCTTSLRP